MTRHLLALVFILLYTSSFCQPSDSVRVTVLPEITVVGNNSSSDVHQMPEIVGTNIYAGKKSTLVVVDNVQGNLVTNTMRQVFAKVPGIFIWENESSGIQINVSARGLSPNRSWEFNVRQNGYDISADPFGYPEAYYNPQLQSVQRIEVVRGHGSLQYGPQIGGMVNYILKNGSQFTKPVQVETYQTIGSFGLFNTYNAIGGNTDKIHYYAFFDHRSADGWRDNNSYRSNTGSGTFTYRMNKKLSITGEFTRWHSRSQQPGGLTDAQFIDNARQSVRSRNWFDLAWTTYALSADYRISEKQRLNFKFFGMGGDRNSVGFFPGGGIAVEDALQPATGNFANRTIDIDLYRNVGSEIRHLLEYNIGNVKNYLSSGVRFFNGKTDRFRGGIGSTGTRYEINRDETSPWVGDINFNSNNIALFAENLISIGNRVNIIPGVRYEYLESSAEGHSGLASGNPVTLQPQQRNVSFLLGGLGLEFLTSNDTRLYANVTQSYRPVQFADLTTPPTTDVIDPDLSDIKAVNMDIGFKGSLKQFLQFDVSLYQLNYDNRIGLLRQQREDGTFYNLRTNIGESTSRGVEAFAEIDVLHAIAGETQSHGLNLFLSGAYNRAVYKRLRATSVVDNAIVETDLSDKRVEYAPESILRSGVGYRYKNFQATVQYSYTAEVFTDANNTVQPTANAQNGLIPSYQVVDLALSYRHTKGFSVRSGINNLSNEEYFTRRSAGYPGPGILPADGRNFFITLGYVMP